MDSKFPLQHPPSNTTNTVIWGATNFRPGGTNWRQLKDAVQIKLIHADLTCIRFLTPNRPCSSLLRVFDFTHLWLVKLTNLSTLAVTCSYSSPQIYSFIAGKKKSIQPQHFKMWSTRISDLKHYLGTILQKKFSYWSSYSHRSSGHYCSFTIESHFSCFTRKDLE